MPCTIAGVRNLVTCRTGEVLCSQTTCSCNKKQTAAHLGEGLTLSK